MSRSRLQAIFVAVALAIAALPARAQLTLIEGSNIESEAPVYLDANGDLHAALVKVKFSEEVVGVTAGTEALTLSDLLPAYAHVRDTLLALEGTYGSIGLVKRYPDVVWGDTLVVDPATQQTVTVADLSQWVELHFGAPVPLAEVGARLKALPEVQYVDPPYVYHLNVTLDPITPDDDDYAAQWNLPIVKAADAWALARGFVGEGEPVAIGLAETFAGTDIDDDGVEAAVHPDLRDDSLLGTLRLDNTAVGNRYGDHGIWVAGHAGAITDNADLETAGSVASLAWTVALRGFRRDATGIREAVCRMPGQTGCDPVDVLNMSWSVYDCTPGVPDSPDSERAYDCGELVEALGDALGTSAILTGSTGNEHCRKNPPQCCRPCQPIPGGYYSPEHGRGVLTINATASDYSVDADYNFADPNADPVTQPALGWMDLAAPGRGVLCLDTAGPGLHGTLTRSGTSFSAPTAASLVALLLSVNPDLTHAQVYEALVRTADEVGSGTYGTPGHFGEGWDPYYGYGQINAYEAVRYVVEHFGGRIGGTSDSYVYRITEPLTLHDGAHLAIRPGTTLDVRADLLVEAGATLSVEAGATLAFQPSADLTVAGTLLAAGATFTAANESQGWGGLRFDVDPLGLAPPPSVLTGSVIEHVKGPLFISGDAAVEVYGGTVTLSGTVIQDGANVHGLWASGASTLVTLNQGSEVRRMSVDGTGAVAAGGAEVRVYDSVIRDNGYTGVGATGMGSRLYLYQSQVLDNGGFGVGSETWGEVYFHKPGTPVPAEGVEVSGHTAKGGLYALASGDITAGIYDENADPGYCVAACQNLIVSNWQGGGNFDAKSVGGAVLWAEYNFWGQDRALGDLELVTNTGGFLDVTPLWDGTSLRAAAPAAWRGGQGEPLTVAALVDETYRARAQGDSAAATAALREALPLALTDDERGLAYGLAGRFLGHTRASALEAYLATRTRPGDAARPHALTALLAAHAAQDRTGEAWATARTLATEYAGSDHALAGLAMTVRLAAGAGDLASAEEALAGLREGWPDLVETEAAEALVRRLWGDGAGGRVGGPTTADATGGLMGFRLLGARPNPFRGQAVVPFEVGEAAQVRVAVYDVLGREVAVLTEGEYEAGRYEVALDGSRLASGLYLVRAHVEKAEAVRSYVARVMVVR